MASQDELHDLHGQQANPANDFSSDQTFSTANPVINAGRHTQPAPDAIPSWRALLDTINFPNLRLAGQAQPYSFYGEWRSAIFGLAPEPRTGTLCAPSLDALLEKVAVLLHVQGQDSLFGLFRDWNVSYRPPGSDHVDYLFEAHLSDESPKQASLTHFIDQLDTRLGTLAANPLAARLEQDRLYLTACAQADRTMAVLWQPGSPLCEATLHLTRKQVRQLDKIARHCDHSIDALVTSYLKSSLRVALVMANPHHTCGFEIPWREACLFDTRLKSVIDAPFASTRWLPEPERDDHQPAEIRLTLPRPVLDTVSSLPTYASGFSHARKATAERLVSAALDAHYLRLYAESLQQLAKKAGPAAG